MNISNDIKYNKIKAIEEKLANYWWYIFNTTENDYKDAEDVKKYADAKTWELANQIYDIATGDCTCLSKNTYKYYTFPISYTSHLKEFLYELEYYRELRKHSELNRMYRELENYRQQYDYRNS